jgi:hypothetical protein
MKDIVDDKLEKTIQKYNKRIDKKNEIELKRELNKKERKTNNYIYDYIKTNYSKLMKKYKDKKIVSDKLTKEIIDNPYSNPFFNNLTDKNIEIMDKQFKWWEINYNEYWGKFNNDNENNETEELNNNTDNNNDSPILLF